MSTVLASPDPEPVMSRLHAYEALIEIGSRLHGASDDVDGALRLIVEQARRLLVADMAWLVLADEERGVLRPVLLRGFRRDAFLDVELPIPMGVGGSAIARGCPVVIDDYRHWEHPTLPAVRDTILGEDAVSMICAPMRREQDLVGTLYVANRRRTDFSQEAVWLLGALATQASMAIESRRLYHRLREQNELLESAFGVHRRLMRASLEEQGLVGLATVVSELVGRPLVIEQEICEPRRVRVEGGDRAAAGRAVPRQEASDVLPIKAGMGRLGTLEVFGDAPLTPLQVSALEQGTTLLALELLKERAGTEVGWRLSGELLEELLASPHPVPPPLARRATHLHVDVAQPHRMLAIAPAEPGGDRGTRLLDIARGMIARRAPGHGSQALGVRRPREVLLALPAALAGRAEEIAQAIQDAARPVVGELYFGIGSLDADLAASHRAAMACLRLARSADTPGRLVDYDDFGPLRFLLDAADVRNAALIAREPLEPLLAHDRTHRTPLLATTRAYLETGGHHGRCAERCCIAVSSLKYRLRKIEEVLAAHPGDPELAFRLTLAFKVHDLLGVLGIEEPDPEPRPDERQAG